MLRIKNFRVALRLSTILVTLLALMLCLLFFVIGQPPDTEFLFLLFFLILFFFIFSVFLIHYRIERFILNKIKGIYNDLSPSGVSMSQQIVQSDMEALRECTEICR